MSKHSPAPWKFQEWGNQILDSREGSSQCLVATVAINTFMDEGRHNNRLITAAPELLMALEFLLEQCEGFNVSGVYFNEFRENRDALDTAYDAVAKATGGAA